MRGDDAIPGERERLRAPGTRAAHHPMGPRAVNVGLDVVRLEGREHPLLARQKVKERALPGIGPGHRDGPSE